MVEIYVSVDVETDGPIPGPNSMLSLGAAAFVDPRIREFDCEAREKFGVTLFPGALESVDRKEPLATYSVNLETLPGVRADPETAAWWKTQPEAWEACRKDQVPPAVAIRDFVQWVKNLPGIETNKLGAVNNAVFVGYPAGFDFTFVYWYIRRFGLQSPFSFSALDIKTFAMAVMGMPYRDTVKRNMPKEWFPKNRPHTHVAIDDAIEQGILFLNILEASRKRL